MLLHISIRLDSTQDLHRNERIGSAMKKNVILGLFPTPERTSCCDPDPFCIQKSAESYKKTYHTDNDYFYYGFGDKGVPNGFVEATTGCCRSNLEHLVICAHGNEMYVDDFRPEELAAFLYRLGIRSVEHVIFKACEVGNGDYLGDFIAACRQKSIEVGEAKGYIYSTATVHKCCLCCGPAHEATGGIIRSVMYILGSFCYLGCCFGCEPCGGRYKVVSGRTSSETSQLLMV